MAVDYREGCFHKIARENFELPCRNCGATVQEADGECFSCGIYAPGIYSECPMCGSKDYFWKRYGVNKGAVLGGVILFGPLGVFAGVIGGGDAECVCLKCGQGWMPYGFPGGKWNVTRKFKLKAKSYVRYGLNRAGNVSGRSQGRANSVQSSSQSKNSKSSVEQRNSDRYGVENSAGSQSVSQVNGGQKAKQNVKKKTNSGGAFKTLFWLFVLTLIAIRGAKIYANMNSDQWKQVYDDYLSEKPLYDKVNYYRLLDMNYDGIPELINIYRNQDKVYNLEICTSKDGYLITWFHDYNVIPSALNRSGISFYQVNEEGYPSGQTYRCRVRLNGRTNVVEKKGKTNPLPMAPYFEGAITAGTYEDIIKNDGYLLQGDSFEISEQLGLTSNESSIWFYNPDELYTVLSQNASLEEAYKMLNVQIDNSGKWAEEEYMTFRVDMLGDQRFLKYNFVPDDDIYSNYFAYTTQECLNEDYIVSTLGLDFIGVDQNHNYCYVWNNKLKVVVHYYANATDLDFYLY